MKQQNWNVKDYAQHSKGQELWARELIAKLDLQGNENILDLGCGDGKVTALLAKLTSGKIVGIDKSKTMIAFAKNNHDNIEFRVMDARKLSFEHNFDLVFSNAVLHWIDDHEAILNGIKKSLHSNGKILLQFGGEGTAREIIEVMEAFISKRYFEYFRDFKFPYNFPHSDEYRVLLERVGFKNIEAELIPKDMLHDNVEAFKGWIRTTWFPYTDCLPQNMREGFIDRFVEAYLALKPLDNKGRVHVDMVRLEVRAVK